MELWRKPFFENFCCGVGRVAERSRWRRMPSARVGARVRAMLVSSRWYKTGWRKWQRHEHISVLESRAFVKCAAKSALHKIWTAHQTESRRATYKILTQVRHCSALCLSRLTSHMRWIPSDVNNSDEAGRIADGCDCKSFRHLRRASKLHSVFSHPSSFQKKKRRRVVSICNELMAMNHRVLPSFPR